MQTLDDKVGKLKTWAEANYTRGTDTFVECWDRSDYEKLLADSQGSPRRALATMKRMAGIYADQQADAAYHRSQAVEAPQANEAQVIASALSILAGKVMGRDVMSAPNDVKQYLQLRLGTLEHEVFAVMFLDAQNRVIRCEEMFRGTLTQTSVYPREVIKAALGHNAAAVILTHSHPSGMPEPSRADEHLTANLKTALAFVDVRVLDHIVVGASGTVSFAERGLI